MISISKLKFAKSWHLRFFVLRDKTMADKLMYIPNDDTNNYPFCRLKLVVETFEYTTESTNQKSPKSSKMLSQWIRKPYYVTL